MKSKADMVAEIVDKISTMKELTERIRKHGLFCHPQLENLKGKEIEVGYKWILSIYPLYADWKAIRNLRTEEMWKRYEAWGDFSEHQESLLLKQKEAVFKKAIQPSLVPAIFKKSYVNEMLGGPKANHKKKESKESEEQDRS